MSGMAGHRPGVSPPGWPPGAPDAGRDPGSHRGPDVPYDAEAGGGASGGTHPRDAAGPVHAVPWERARRIAATAPRGPLPAVEVELASALGHTLAAPLAALTDLPAFDTAAMDGWAVAGPGPWRLRGRVLAGQHPEPIADGSAVRIATGAQLPPGATAVLRREHGVVEPRPGPPGRGGAGAAEPRGGAADAEEGVLHDRAPVRLEPGRDVRPRGQECRRGEPLLPAGTAVGPAVLGLAAAAGCDRLAVRRRPAVDLLVLGDELLESGVPAAGRVRDALGPMLEPWLRSCGALVAGRRHVRDDFALLRDAVRLSRADVLVTTGGTAAGPVDFLHGALAEAGARLLVDGVAVRPGHPMLLAALPPAPSGTGAGEAAGPGPGRFLVGLPGNPLAATAGAVTLVLPLLRALSGRAQPRPRRVPAADDLPGHPRDTRLVPVRVADGRAHPLAFDGPAMLRGLALADGLAVLPPGGVRAGGPLEVLPVPAA